MTQAKSKKTRLTGTVVADSADKTVRVRVVSTKRHFKYDKRYTVHKSFLAHDEKNESKKGDRVEIEENTPKSKLKKWIVVGKVK